MSKNRFTVFSKPWNQSLEKMAARVKQLGFDGVELPVRPGFQVEPESIEKKLPAAVRILGDHGLVIASVAGPTDQRTIAACGECGIPIIRTLVKVPPAESYMKTMADALSEFDKLIPALEKSGVTIGIQNHCYREVSSVMGIRYLVERFDPAHIAGVLDVGHCGLAGEFADLAVDILWDHLCMVNLKNAVWCRREPSDEQEGFGPIWTTGPEGMGDWKRFIDELKKRDYSGDFCLTAEYSASLGVDMTDAEPEFNEMITEDLAYAKSLLV